MTLVAYTLGCFNTGYYLIRGTIGSDIRSHGSGSTGARNVARVGGVSGAVITFLGDFIKGALAVYVASYFNGGMESSLCVLLAVVTGHIWPAQLRFRGGKGIATSIGAMFLFDWQLMLSLILLFLLILLLLKQFTLSGLLVVTMAPAITCIEGRSAPIILGTAALSCVLLFAHQDNIRILLKSMVNHEK